MADNSSMAMIRSLSVLCAVLFALAQQVGTSAQVAETVDDPEAYAVYSAVLTHMLHFNLKNVSHLPILQETFRGNGPGCQMLKDTPWQSARDNYDAQNARDRTLLPNLTLEVRYTLGPSAMLAPLVREGRSRYLPLALSAVGFDTTKSHAYVSVHHGNNGYWGIPMVKRDGLWILAPGVPHCTVMA